VCEREVSDWGLKQVTSSDCLFIDLTEPYWRRRAAFQSPRIHNWASLPLGWTWSNKCAYLHQLVSMLNKPVLGYVAVGQGPESSAKCTGFLVKVSKRVSNDRLRVCRLNLH